MDGNVLLDTNVVIALLDGDRGVTRKVRGTPGVYIPCIVLGELFYGAFSSQQVQKNLKRVETLAAANTVLVCDTETSRRFGQIKTQLRRKGRPLPENDIWIAALARQHGLTLISRDSHFEEVEGLRLDVW